MDEKVRKKNKKAKTKLTVDSIRPLGGEKDDLSLIGNVDGGSDESDFETLQDDFDVDPVNKYELRDFIEKLEIYKYKPQDDDQSSGAESENEVVKAKEKKEKKSKKKKVSSKDGERSNENEEDESKDELADIVVDQASGSNEESKLNKTKKVKNKYKSLVQHNEISSTTRDQSQNYRTHMQKYQPRKYLLVKSSADYYDQLDEASVEDASNKVSNDLLKQMEGFAAKLLQDEISIYNRQKEMAKKSNVGWMKTVIASGTLADKIAALTVLVQESPVHSIAHIDTLLTMTKKHVKRESVQAADALKEMFLTQLIPDKRKLLPFSQRPLSGLYAMTSGNKENMDKKLMLWYYESQLKERYSLFVKSLQEMSHNPLLAIRTKAVSTINQLLIHKPEEEKTLLTLLLNKIGDPHYKLASTVSYSLLQLVEKHPNMKEVVVREVEHLLFRPNISQSAQYYSICFLNQLKLSHFEKVLAIKLIKIYFAFFRASMKKGEVDSKMMSALLSGVNRAYPYAELEEDFLSGQIDNLYKLVHIVNFGTSVQALSLLYQVMDTSNAVSERYYTALYKKLADPALKSASKPALFLNLLYKSLKSDESDRRRRAFIKRILQVLFYQQSQFICGALILISEILKAYPGLLTMSSQEEESDDEEHFVDVPDPDSDSEGIKTEKADDAKEEKKEVKPAPFRRNDQKPKSWIHRRNKDYSSDIGTYDPYLRNPLFCHADKECVWELEKLTRHYHPSVSLFATKLLQGEHIKYDGNPLQDFTIIRFLDRFVFKNPKKEQNTQKRVATLGRVQYVPSGVKTMTVDSEEFLKLDEKKIPVDDLFYHRYFTRKALIKKKKVEEDEVSDVSDEEFDEYLDKLEKDNNDELALGYDFASEFEKRAGKKIVDSSSDEDDDEDDMESMTLGGEEVVAALSDEEVDFDDDEEYAEAMEEKMEGLLDDGLDDDDEADDDEDDDDNLDDDVKTKMAAFDDDGDDDGDDDDGGLDFDEEEVSFSDDEDEFKELMPKGKSVKRKAPTPTKFGKSQKKGKKSAGTEGAFAAAEEFGDLMDENAGSMIDMTGSGAMSTRDKAGAKQLKWEMERDKWLRGESWKEKKRKKFGNKPGSRKPKGRFNKRK